MSEPQNTEYSIAIMEDGTLTILRRNALAKFLEDNPQFVFSQTRNGHDEYIIKESE